MKIIRAKRGQGMLESVIVFVVVLLFFGGIFRIWSWANNQIVNRQLRYNITRQPAGFASDNYQLNAPSHPWPVYRPQNLEESNVIIDAPETK